MLERLNSAIWGIPTLVLILGTGLYFSIKTGFLQLKFRKIFTDTILSLFKTKKADFAYNKTKPKNSISQFQTLSASLAATMGTGNIVGVASALVIGGAGAIFWMWISAFFGMMLVYAENYFSIQYRRKNEHKQPNKPQKKAGAFAYLTYGAKSKTLAVFFGICCILTSFGMGSSAQSGSAATALESLGISKILSGIVLAVVAGIIIIGGIKRIGKFAEILIPFLSVSYILVSLAVIFKNRTNIDDAFIGIFRGALGLREVGGGVSGYALSRVLNVGLRRGVFSNEAGLGTSALMHSDVDSEDPVLQGEWGITEVFIDTFLCCTLTAITILTAAVPLKGDPTDIVINAFQGVLGDFSAPFISVTITLFAFATLVSWSHCGESASRYLFGDKSAKIYKAFFVIAVFTGAVISLDRIWEISDIFNGLMLFPNIFGLLLLSKEIMSNE